jgi:integrase
VADGAIARNPCNIRGAGEERSPERPVLSVDEVDLLAGTVPRRFRALILVAAYSGLRLGELLALRRSSIADGRVMVLGQRYYLNGVGKVMAPPKTSAGRRTVMLPRSVAVELNAHMRQYAEPGADGFVFTGDKGGPLDRVQWGKVFRAARDRAGLPADLKFHDLRHTGNTLAVQLGANQADLMARMGHASEAAARRYLHTTKARDEAIAEALDGLVTRSASRP